MVVRNNQLSGEVSMSKVGDQTDCAIEKLRGAFQLFSFRLKGK